MALINNHPFLSEDNNKICIRLVSQRSIDMFSMLRVIDDENDVNEEYLRSFILQNIANLRGVQREDNTMSTVTGLYSILGYQTISSMIEELLHYILLNTNR